MDNHLELLLASQVEAKRVLDEAARRSQEILAGAERTARELLLSQADQAARLLLQQHEVATAALLAAEGDADAMGAREGHEFMKRHRVGAEVLRDDEARIAVELVEAERKLATQTKDAASNEACRILMDGHREAAAILLEARLRVEDARHLG